MGILTSLFGCNGDNSSSNIHSLDNFAKTDGFVDIPLSITSTKDIGTHYEYYAKSTLYGDTLGVGVKLKKNIPEGLHNGEPTNMFLDKGIELFSIGSESDNLLSFISEQYGNPKKALTFKSTGLVTCANLNESPVNYSNGAYRFKIFLESEQTDAELFVNFDFSNNMIFLNEKDEGYRDGLIKSLQ